MENRILHFTGIHNFRDYGGYSARDGARVRTGLLYRSSQHRDATAADLAAIDALQLSTVIDLRGDSERTLYPCPRPTAFGAEVRFADGETAGHAPHIEADRDVQTVDDATRAMTLLYRHMPFRPNLVEVFRLYFDALAHRDGPNLIHCLAGKDRTGIAVALLHDMLGVHPDDMMADYLLTNVAGNMEARIAAGADVVRQNFGPTMDDAAVRTLMSVDAAYLDAAFDAIIDAHGSLAAYRRDMLGVGLDVETRIIERLL
jgi:protein-tyrosine phosphatase